MSENSLKELRLAKGWTLQNLSDISGITIANLSLYERGLSTPTVLTRLRLESILGQRILFQDAADKKVRYINPVPIRTK